MMVSALSQWLKGLQTMCSPVNHSVTSTDCGSPGLRINRAATFPPNLQKALAAQQCHLSLGLVVDAQLVTVSHTLLPRRRRPASHSDFSETPTGVLNPGVLNPTLVVVWIVWLQVKTSTGDLKPEKLTSCLTKL